MIDSIQNDTRKVLVGWEPYHVRLGYGWDQNTVTAASALAWGNNVTIEIRLPENWDELIAPMGYEPMSHFLLNGE